ncbi:DUF262 domain-containing protein [Bacillus paralicheniformis]|uniref:DUF262 domain-containing protein n=1 Tax=Bacillus paralicheniformis TaxID=1648923 RepID=UPI00128B9A46|nr:DUF262 domain-containing protein [Bacillus paralicheniformis]MPQ23567.1 DUF262 domain-containing protein [Bacillus paralicheniformis]
MAELSTNSIKIDKLRSKILDGEIKIPPFQRGYVWNQEQIIDLLDSIYNDYPIGSILLWETTENLPSERNLGGFLLPDVEEEYPKNYVLDGQQRVTTIFGVFCRELEQTEDDFTVSPELFDVYFDINDKKFTTADKMNETHTNLSLKLLFDNFNFNKEITNYSLEENETAVKLQSLFQNYELPTVTIKRRKKSEVGIIFERINNSGTHLSTLDLMIAWTWTSEYHLKEVFDDLYDLLDKKNFGGIKQKIILQCYSAIIKKETKTSAILNLEPEEVRDSTGILQKSLEKAIDYLATQFNIKSEDFLPKSHQLVPITYLFSKVNYLDSLQSGALAQWFWRTSFSKRYSAGTDAAMDSDLKFMDDILLNEFSGLNKYQSDVSVEQLKSHKFTKSSSLVKSFLLLLSQSGPLDLTNGNKIELGNSMSTYNRKEYHHIFPKNFLKGKGYKTNEINSLCNFCFLPSSSNKLISDKKPSIYFESIVPKDKLHQIIESNLLPIDYDIYLKNDFNAFITQRAKLIKDRILDFTGEAS